MLAPNRTPNFTTQFRKHFTPVLGLNIAPAKSDHYEGTGGLCLREGNDSDRDLLLTCAHIARPIPENTLSLWVVLPILVL